MDLSIQCGCYFLGFSIKAFDKVPKTRILQKLSAYGIEVKVLCWIADFLEGNILNVLMLSAGFHKGLYWDLSCF